MATTRKRTVIKPAADPAPEEVVTAEVKPEPEKKVAEAKKKTEEPKKKVEPKKEYRQYNQNDLVLCRSVTAGWLGFGGKSGQYYVWENMGDLCEVEYQDLFALKSRKSRYLYAPLFVIEDEELLENPRWNDLAKFYEEQVYTMDDVEEVLNLPFNAFKDALLQLPNGLSKSLQVRVAQKIEDGTFDSLKKIKMIDEVYGTDFKSVLAK